MVALEFCKLVHRRFAYTHTLIMLPRSSLDILSLASKKPVPKPTPTGLLFFALPQTSRVYGVSGTTDDRNSESVPGTGSSRQLYKATVPSPTTFSFSLGPLYVHGQQDGTRCDRISCQEAL